MYLRGFCFLIVFVSTSAIAAPPYYGTVSVSEKVINTEDPSTFIQFEAAGTGLRQLYDRRENDGLGAWVFLDALLFNAFYTDGETVEIQVNPEFEASEAAITASFYAHKIGQLPGLLRIDVKTMSIHKGDKPFGGGTNNILIHTEAPAHDGERLEETLFHEACHVSLDSRLANTPAWLNAQSLDAEFISTYARDNPVREDVAESCLPYFAVKFRADRLSESTLAILQSTIPNRLAVLDTLDMKPVVQSDRPASFDLETELLQLPAVKVEDQYFEVTLKLADIASLRFSIETAAAADTPSYDLQTQFSNGILDIPVALVAGTRYALRFRLTNSDPIEFTLISATELKQSESKGSE